MELLTNDDLSIEVDFNFLLFNAVIIQRHF